MGSGPDDKALPTHLSVWDAVSIIIGIVVGAGIFETPPIVLRNLGGPWMVLGAWAVGGLLCLNGALCYAELATTYPQTGGEYVYLSRAYGRWLGFLFGWAQLAVILTANIGMMTFIFADYGEKLFQYPKESGWIWAGSAVVVLTVLNILGLKAGKRTQNVLTVAKVLGLGAVVVAGLCWPTSASLERTVGSGEAPIELGIAFAMVQVFITYGGWNDSAYVAAELHDGRRNIPRALLLGTGSILVIYLLVNFAYLRGLGYDKAMESKVIAADLLSGPFGAWGKNLVSILVMISALGAANGLIFTGSRVALKLGREHAMFGWLGHWHARRGAPYVALLTQGAISLAMIGMVGIPAGQEFMNGLFAKLGLPAVDWAGKSGFETLLKCSVPIFWGFFLLTGLSLFVLRFKDAGRLPRRPFSAPLFPLTPLLFCATCLYMLYSGVMYAWTLGLVGGALLALGVPVYLMSELMSKRRPGPEPAVEEGGPGATS